MMALIASPGLSACSAAPEAEPPENPGNPTSGGTSPASGGTSSGGSLGAAGSCGGVGTGSGQGGLGAGGANGGGPQSSGGAGAPSGGTSGAASGGQSGGPSGGAGVAMGGSSGAPPSSSGGTAGMTEGTAGSGGTAGTGEGTAGSGGTAGGMMASGGTAGEGTAGSGGTAGGMSGSGGGAGAPSRDIECPAGATFCTGFEGSAFPDGTQWHMVGPPAGDGYRFDTTEKAAGNQSLRIQATGSGGFLYRALAMPIPGNDFWVRLHMRLGTPLGDNSHDSVFGASSGNLAADVNGEALIELSEQFEQVLLNTDDALFTPMTKSKIAANTWHCIEAHYDGGNGTVEIWVNGEQLINAPGYQALSLQSFRIGYMRYNDDRDVWFDDVIIGPTRIACP